MRRRLADAAQCVQRVYVEHVVGKRPVAERRIEVRPSGEYLPSRFAEKRQRFVECPGFRVTDHAMPRGAMAGKIIRMQMISTRRRLSKPREKPVDADALTAE